MKPPAYRLRGTVLPGGTARDVYVVDGRITFDPVESARLLLDDAVILPGLVDVHAHLSLASPAGDAASAAERVVASARSHLDAGVLALREPGSPDHESRDLGPADGLPRITTAGRFLSPPGRYFPGLAREVDEGGLVEAALEELAWSGAWVKLIGDSPLGGDGITRTFTDAALAHVTAAVHGAGGRVSVHCTVPEVIGGALDAGVDSLEHGSFMTPDLLPVLRQADVTWVPTCSINDAVRGLVRNVGYSESAIRHVETCLDAQPEVIRQAVADGVRVLAGTDAGMVPHGMVRREIELLIAAGVPVEAALGAGSWTARSWLGLPLVEEGAPADLVAYREDPRDDPAVLAVPAVIILDGELLVPASV